VISFVNGVGRFAWQLMIANDSAFLASNEMLHGT